MASVSPDPLPSATSKVSWRVLRESALDQAAVELFLSFRENEDPETYRRLFELTSPRLMSALRLVLQRHGAFEDPVELLTDAFGLAYQSRHTFEPKGGRGFLRWILAVATNHVRQRHRERRRRDRREESVAVGIHDRSQDPLTKLLRSEDEGRAERLCELLRVLVLEGLALLRPSHRQVLLLHSLHGMRYHEIASHLSLGASAVAMRIKRSRERILQHVTRRLEDLEWSATTSPPLRETES